MAQFDLLKAVVEALERAGGRYMLTGSWASSLQGEPRSTHDVDLVVSLGPEVLGHLLRAFPPPRYYLDQALASEALVNLTLFQLLDSEEGDKIDFWPLTKEPFDLARFERRREVRVKGLPLLASTPEDTILMKLLWSKKAGGSDKQIHDAKRVWEVQESALDKAYIDSWVGRLGLGLELKKLAEP